MLLGDWTSMTQAVWRSPLLPLQKSGSSSPQSNAAIGTGTRFKRDLLAYLKAYGPKKTGPLVQQLQRYDFGAIRAALVASVPSKQQFSSLDSDKGTLWGWPALRDLLGRIPTTRQTKEDGGHSNRKAHVVAQVRHLPCINQRPLTTIRSLQLPPSARQTNGSKTSSSSPSHQNQANHNPNSQSSSQHQTKSAAP